MLYARLPLLPSGFRCLAQPAWQQYHGGGPFGMTTGKTLVFAMVLAGGAGAETFSGDVYPVVRAKCQGCHQAGEIAPMAFTTYADTRPWAKAIREAVVGRSMPPWHAG